ncbi:reverse transcriptase zinc-binding domain-containing protein [Tanacetum coccineum]
MSGRQLDNVGLRLTGFVLCGFPIVFLVMLSICGLLCRKVSKQDKLRPWDVGLDTDLNQIRCAFCDLQPDSHDHLFFECSFSSQVWLYVRHLADMDNIQPIFHNIVAHLQPMAKKRTTQSIIGKLIFAATSYFIWNKRNNRLFKKTRRTPEEIQDLIMVTVRVKLISFRSKNKDNVNRSQVEDLFRVWYPNREFQVRVVLFFPSPRFFPLGFPREGFLRRQSCLDHRPPYVWMVDVAAWKLRKADWDLS